MYGSTARLIGGTVKTMTKTMIISAPTTITGIPQYHHLTEEEGEPGRQGWAKRETIPGDWVVDTQMPGDEVVTTLKLGSFLELIESPLEIALRETVERTLRTLMVTSPARDEALEAVMSPWWGPSHETAPEMEEASTTIEVWLLSDMESWSAFNVEEEIMSHAPRFIELDEGSSDAEREIFPLL